VRKALAASGAGSDVECVDVGSTAFSSTVAGECTIPFGAVRARDRHKSGGHLCGFLGPGIELGYQLTRIEEETRYANPAGVDHDEIPRTFSMRRLQMHPG